MTSPSQAKPREPHTTIIITIPTNTEQSCQIKWRFNDDKSAERLADRTGAVLAQLQLGRLQGAIIKALTEADNDDFGDLVIERMGFYQGVCELMERDHQPIICPSQAFLPPSGAPH